MNDSDTISENISHLIGDGSQADAKTVVVGRGDAKTKLHDGSSSLG